MDHETRPDHGLPLDVHIGIVDGVLDCPRGVLHLLHSIEGACPLQVEHVPKPGSDCESAPSVNTLYLEFDCHGSRSACLAALDGLRARLRDLDTKGVCVVRCTPFFGVSKGGRRPHEGIIASLTVPVYLAGTPRAREPANLWLHYVGPPKQHEGDDADVIASIQALYVNWILDTVTVSGEDEAELRATVAGSNRPWVLARCDAQRLWFPRNGSGHVFKSWSDRPPQSTDVPQDFVP